MKFRRWRAFSSVLLLTSWAAVLAADGKTVPWPVQRNRVDPREFGTQDETITVISAVSFESLFPDPQVPNLAVTWQMSSNFGRYCNGCSTLFVEYYATLTVPAGAVIDYVGVNNATTADAVMGVAVWQRDRYGNPPTMLVGYSFPAHAWDTDFAGPLGIQVSDHVDKELLIQVEQAPSPDNQYFAWVEVRWHRQVSAPPQVPTFGDVPTTDFAYQYIEALAASGITGGCGGNNYCPDANLTRRQMAIFLAKALGLHWPD